MSIPKHYVHSLKGMSLATDTIVYLVLAVLVLTVLLFFFTKNSGEGVDATQLQLDRGRYCSTYIQFDMDCDGSIGTDEGPSNKVFTDEQEKLTKICPKINPAACTGQLTNTCLQSCCFVCPKK